MFIIRNKKMIALFDAQFLLPIATGKASIFTQNLVFRVYPRTQFFHSSAPLRKKSNLSIGKSTEQAAIAQDVDGVTRMVKSEAQAALFDYLHSTRGYGFLDAEHISKNSPNFLQYLIDQVGKEKEVSRVLTKFFRYHPINEFEPFFESIGLNPSEVAYVVPRGLMFLCDDQTLLDNYHALANYGVPRSKIGRIYMEGNKVFHDEHGVLDGKLKEYERLGLSRSTVIKLVTCSPLLLVGDVNKSFVGVLKRLEELGFDSNWIGVYLSANRTYNWNRILETLNFLIYIGYDDGELKKLVKNENTVIFDGSGKQVCVMASALLKLGLDMNGVYHLVLQNPRVLLPKCYKNFWKALHFLFEIEMEPEDIVQILCSHIDSLSSHSMSGPKTMLRIYGGNKERLRSVISKDPSAFFDVAFKQKTSNPEIIAARNPGNIWDKTQFLLRIGYSENTDAMVKALKKFRGRGDQLQERFDCLMQAGLDFSTVSTMVKHAPPVLNQSRDVLKKKIYFLKEYMGYPSEAMAAFPSYLCYDMERITARFSMYAWLREREAAKPMISLSTLLASSEARFMKYFVNIHPEGPAAWENITKSLLSWDRTV